LMLWWCGGLKYGFEFCVLANLGLNSNFMGFKFYVHLQFLIFWATMFLGEEHEEQLLFKKLNDN